MIRTAFLAALAMAPTAALAEGTMPQMDFSNPLTTSQVVWMVIILVALELLVAGLQAYVFAILTCLYLHDAVHMH